MKKKKEALSARHMGVNLSTLETHVHTVRHCMDKHVEGLFFCRTDRVFLFLNMECAERKG